MTDTNNQHRFILPEKLKQRLYPVVMELFSEQDFHQVNIRTIYKKTGISPSTIYKYFNSKEDLLFTILDEKISEVGELVELHIQGLESSREILRKIFWVTFDYYDKNRGIAISAFITVPMRSWMKESSYVRKDTTKYMTTFLEHGLARGELDTNLTVPYLVDCYYMCCHRQVQLWYYHGCKWKLVDGFPRFFDFLWKTVSNPVI
ncbi:MAG: TetR/AcrR family transcriptional regulator [Proteobacteria bacterium]|nr:TetR/AcrR family transcriptional regulator [Pseudomonadota bacterium]